MCTPDLIRHTKENVKGEYFHSFLSVIDAFWPTNPSSDFNTAIICGIEAHACVLQTALDLLDHNRQVYVVADAVSARSLTDR